MKESGTKYLGEGHDTCPGYKVGISTNLPDYVIYVNQLLDIAKDYHRFDILTSRWVIEHVMRYLEI